jgi:uncharacterized membrane protein YeaQ/YmgE (transglycosylase-associated protein family)
MGRRLRRAGNPARCAPGLGRSFLWEVEMGILLWVIVGFAAGLVARQVMPGPSAGGMLVAIPLGIGGAVLGGLLGNWLIGGGFNQFELRSLLLAISGALLTLLAYRSFALRGSV